MNPHDITKSNEAMWKRVREIQDCRPLPKKAALKAVNRRATEKAARWKQHIQAVNEQRKISKDLGVRWAELMGEDTVKEYIRRMSEVEKRFRKQKRPVAPKMDVHPRITTGSLLTFLVPPYSYIWTSSQVGNPQPVADKNAGTFGCSAQGNGGQSIGYAGIAALYSPISDQPVGHFRPFVEVSTYLYCWSSFYTAHNNGFLNAEVMEYDQSGNLVSWPPYQTYIPPIFQGSSSGNGSEGPTGTDFHYAGVIDVTFPLRPGHTYALWVYNEVEADDAGTNFWGGGSGSSCNMNVSIPFVVVEEGQS